MSFSKKSQTSARLTYWPYHTVCSMSTFFRAKGNCLEMWLLTGAVCKDFWLYMYPHCGATDAVDRIIGVVGHTGQRSSNQRSFTDSDTNVTRNVSETHVTHQTRNVKLTMWIIKTTSVSRFYIHSQALDVSNNSTNVSRTPIIYMQCSQVFLCQDRIA